MIKIYSVILYLVVIGVFIYLLKSINNIISSKGIIEGYSYSAYALGNRERKRKNDLKTLDARKHSEIETGAYKTETNLKLDAKGTKLDVKVPASPVPETEVDKQVKECKRINLAAEPNQCDNIGVSVSCGYCADGDNVYYGDKNGPSANVCQKNNWVPPGPRAKYECIKSKERRICRGQKDCGDTGGKKSICAWCPSKETGIVKSPNPGPHGWFPKYPEEKDDKCDWRGIAQRKVQAKWKGWNSPEKQQGTLNIGEGHCEADGDCGPGLSCGVQYQDSPPPGVKGRFPIKQSGGTWDFPKPYKWFGWSPRQKLGDCEGDCDGDYSCAGSRKCIHDRSVPGCTGSRAHRYADYCSREAAPRKKGKVCYRKGAEDWQGDLILAKDCKRFSQNFPCVGRNMLTGPHTDNCLNDLWSKAGCSGTYDSKGQPDTKKKNKDFWQKNAYTIDQLDMYSKSIKMRSNNYNKAKEFMEQCTGQKPNPCDQKYVHGTPGGRPDDCLKSQYKASGCTEKGKLNPDNMNKWKGTGGGISSSQISGLKRNWSVGQISSFYRTTKNKADAANRRPRARFNEAVEKNELCHGTQPKIPFEKPCWNDFKAQMLSHGNVSSQKSGQELQFDSATWKGLRQTQMRAHNAQLASIQNRKHVMYECSNDNKRTGRTIMGKDKIKVKFKEECEKKCSEDPQCKALNFKGKKEECELLQDIRGDKIPVDKRHGVITCLPNRPREHETDFKTNSSVTKSQYETDYFPFWMLMSKSRLRLGQKGETQNVNEGTGKVNKPSWTKFKNRMLEIPGITATGVAGTFSEAVYIDGNMGERYFGDLIKRSRLADYYDKPLLSGWDKTAYEGQSTNKTGLIKYGHPKHQKWVIKNKDSPYNCNNSTFGDPVRGSHKACFVRSPGAGYKYCAHCDAVTNAGCQAGCRGYNNPSKHGCARHNIRQYSWKDCKIKNMRGNEEQNRKVLSRTITRGLYISEEFPYWDWVRAWRRNS